MAIIALDIFCGAGGVTSGLRKAGIRVITGVDREEECRLTYTQNNPSVKFFAGDVRKLSAGQLFAHIHSINEDDHLLLAACAPCQPFSSQNRYRENAEDKAVIRHVERLVKEMRPDFLFLENVPGLKTVKGYSSFRRFLGTLSRLRYRARYEVVDGAEYGIPQHRRRLVLTASVHGEPPWANKTHGTEPTLKPFVTVQEAISKYPPLAAGEEHPTLPNHITAKLMEHNLNRMKATPISGGSRIDWPPDLTLMCHESHDGHTDVYGRMRWDAPAPTLTARCTSLSNGRYGHPEQNRAISVREAAALQSFDDAYIFYGGIKHITRQVGNAVPPLLAEKFGASFVSHADSLGSTRKKLLWQSMISVERANNSPSSIGTKRIKV